MINQNELEKAAINSQIMVKNLIKIQNMLFNPKYFSIKILIFKNFLAKTNKVLELNL